MHLAHVAFLSLDSLIAGLAVAPLLTSASSRLAGAALFGVADAAASSLGALVSLPLAGAFAPALYAVYITIATTLAARGSRPYGAVAALAAALSVDNLVPPAAAPAGIQGAASAAAMLVGLAIGARVVRGLPERQRTAWLLAGVAATACVAVLG